MVEELGSCCGLCETDMDWERTSQVPELGFLCQPAIPAARPRACWQRKFPELSTCNVTLITQWEEQKGGYWSLFALSHWLSFSLFRTPSSFSEPIKIRTSQKKTSGQGSILSIPIATRLNTSVRTCRGWVKWGRLPWQLWPLCHLCVSYGRGGGNAFLTAIRVFSHLAVREKLSH